MQGVVSSLVGTGWWLYSVERPVDGRFLSPGSGGLLHRSVEGRRSPGEAGGEARAAVLAPMLGPGLRRVCVRRNAAQHAQESPGGDSGLAAETSALNACPGSGVRSCSERASSEQLRPPLWRPS